MICLILDGPLGAVVFYQVPDIESLKPGGVSLFYIMFPNNFFAREPDPECLEVSSLLIWHRTHLDISRTDSGNHRAGIVESMMASFCKQFRNFFIIS